MSPELEFLASSVLFGLAQIIISSHSASFQRGYKWTASSREQSVPPLTGMAGRIERATRNYLETFPFLCGRRSPRACIGFAQLDDALRRSVIFRWPYFVLYSLRVGSNLDEVARLERAYARNRTDTGRAMVALTGSNIAGIPKFFESASRNTVHNVRPVSKR
jgi:hypothetical protein